MEKLKDCPFCGGFKSVKLLVINSSCRDHEYYYPFCDECEACIGADYGFATKIEAIKAWKTRA